MEQQPDETIGCPNCNWAGPRRDLLTEYWTVSKCRDCGHVLQNTQSWGSKREDLILADDMTSVEAAVAQIAESLQCAVAEDPKEEVMFTKRWRWTFKDVCQPWAAQTVYEQKEPRIVRIRLCAFENAPGLSGRVRQLNPFSAKHGVEFSAAMGGGFGSFAAPELHLVWWGVEQLVSVGALTPALFAAVLPRLKAAIDEMAGKVAELKDLPALDR